MVVKGCADETAEAVVGDGSGVIALALKGASSEVLAELGKAGAKLVVRNGKVIMVKGHMQLAVDKWGKIDAPVKDEDAEGFDFEPKADHDMSATEYEQVQEKGK